MKTIAEIISDLKNIMSELQKIKDNNVNTNLDFNVISSKSMRSPITPHPLSSFDTHTKRRYITLLLTFALLDQDVLAESISFVHRVAYGAEYLTKGKNLYEEFILAQTVSFKDLDETTLLLKDSNLKYMLIFEMLIILSEYNKGKSESIEFIANLCMLLKINKKQMSILVSLLIVVLSQDIKKITTNESDNEMLVFVNDIKVYLDFLSDDDYEILTLRLNDVNSEINLCNAEWIILDRSKNDILVFMNDIIDMMEHFNKWGNYPINSFLNGKYLREKIDLNIQKRIKMSKYNCKIFLLSQDECELYFSNPNVDKYADCFFFYDSECCHHKSLNIWTSAWWLINGEPYSNTKEDLNSLENDLCYYDTGLGVRPAFWLNLDFK